MYVCMYVCMYVFIKLHVCMYLFVVITYSRVWVNRVRLPILLVVRSTAKMKISLSPYAPESLDSRDGFSRPVLRQSVQSPYSGWIWCLLTGFLPASAAAVIYLFKSPYAIESVPSLVRTDSVHCRESTGKGPVVHNVVPATSAAILQVTMDQLMGASLFQHP